MVVSQTRGVPPDEPPRDGERSSGISRWCHHNYVTIDYMPEITSILASSHEEVVVSSSFLGDGLQEILQNDAKK